MCNRDWQEKLEVAFMEGDSIEWQLVPTHHLEQEHAGYVTGRFPSYFVLSGRFLAVFFETLGIAEKTFCQADGPIMPNYRQVLLAYAILLQKLRAAESLLLSGYPLSGYGLLRDVKDQAVILAALARGDASYRDVIGHEGVSVPCPDSALSDRSNMWKAIKSNRVKQERRIFKETTGTKSGFDELTQQQFRRWETLFHMEIHGGRLSETQHGREWQEGSGPLPIAPAPDDQAISMYMSRSTETGWMVLRVLPFLQMNPGYYDEEWTHKWEILDQSFRQMVEASGATGNQLAPRPHCACL